MLKKLNINEKPTDEGDWMKKIASSFTFIKFFLRGKTP
jgi:hypothetical protein